MNASRCKWPQVASILKETRNDPALFFQNFSGAATCCHLQPLEWLQMAAFFKLKDLRYCNLNADFIDFGSFCSKIFFRSTAFFVPIPHPFQPLSFRCKIFSFLFNSLLFHTFLFQFFSCRPAVLGCNRRCARLVDCARPAWLAGCARPARLARCTASRMHLAARACLIGQFAVVDCGRLRSTMRDCARLCSAVLDCARLCSAVFGCVRLRRLRSAVLGWVRLGSAGLGWARRLCGLGWARPGSAPHGCVRLGSGCARLRSAALGFARLRSAALGYAVYNSCAFSVGIMH